MRQAPSETYWGRVKKDHALAVAGELIGECWVNDRSNSKKTQLAKSMENAFGDEPQERTGLAPDADPAIAEDDELEEDDDAELPAFLSEAAE